MQSCVGTKTPKGFEHFETNLQRTDTSYARVARSRNIANNEGGSYGLPK